MITGSSSGLLQVSATALQGHQQRVDAIAHNLANISTTGFKRLYVPPADLDYEVLFPDPSTGGTQLLEGSGTANLPAIRMFDQGALERTGRELDVAVQGEGFFAVTTADGAVGYTRDGAFGLDSQGRIVTSAGLAVAPGFTVPAGGRVVGITERGEIMASVNGADATALGRVQLARFANASAMIQIGENLFAPTAESGDAVVGGPGDEGFGELVPCTLERSNVDMGEEMVSLLQAQRAYQLNARALQTADEMLALADNIIA